MTQQHRIEKQNTLEYIRFDAQTPTLNVKAAKVRAHLSPKVCCCQRTPQRRPNRGPKSTSEAPAAAFVRRESDTTQSFQRAVNQFKCLKWRRAPEVLTGAFVNVNGECAADRVSDAAETSPPLTAISAAVTLQGATEGLEAQSAGTGQL